MQDITLWVQQLLYGMHNVLLVSGWQHMFVSMPITGEELNKMALDDDDDDDEVD